MSKYALDVDLSSGCWNCPCEDDGWRCSAAGYRDLPIPDDDEPDLPDDYRPEWCPLVPLDDAIVNDFMVNQGAQPEVDEDTVTLRVELYETEERMLGDVSVAHRLTTAQTLAKLISDEHRRLTERRESDHNQPSPCL